MIGVRVLRRQVVEEAVTGIGAEAVALPLQRSAVEQEAEVKALVAAAESEAELKRRVAAAPGIVNVIGVDVSVAIAVLDLVLAHDEGAVSFAGAEGGIQDLVAVGLVDGGETLTRPVVGAATEGAVPAVQGTGLPVIHLGTVVRIGLLTLDVGGTAAGEGGRTLDPVGEVADAVAVVQGEFQTLGLAAVQVLGRNGDRIEIRKVHAALGSRTDHLTLEPVEGTAELALPEFPIHTEVHHTDLGPGENRVGHGIIGVTGRGLSVGEDPRSALVVTIDIGVGAALRGTGVTIGPAEFQVVHEREHALEELLLGDSPTHGV